MTELHMDIDLKSFFAIAATAISVVSYYPYIRDVLLEKTKPHIYTWLIWLITQGIKVVSTSYTPSRL